MEDFPWCWNHLERECEAVGNEGERERVESRREGGFDGFDDFGESEATRRLKTGA